MVPVGTGVSRTRLDWHVRRVESVFSGLSPVTLILNFVVDVSSRSSPEVNRWTHIVGTWDGTTSRLFIDGAEVASIDQPGAAISYPPPSTTNFTIGAFLDTDEYEALQGAILEINVFDRVLPTAEVLLRHCFVSIDGLPPSTACDAPLQTTTPTPQPTRVPSSSPTASPTVDATSESGEQGISLRFHARGRVVIN